MTRLMIYDNTSLIDNFEFKDALANSWKIGGKLYRSLRWLDKIKPVSSWDEALDWLVEETKKEQVSMIQFWGHGYPGYAMIGQDYLTRSSLLSVEKMDRFEKLRDQLPSSAVIWFRTCATFAGEDGQRFAEEFSTKLDCVIAGHTHNIGVFQSGLHTVSPGHSPRWSKDEGVKELVDSTYTLEGSGPFLPRTINCLRGTIPDLW